MRNKLVVAAAGLALGAGMVAVAPSASADGCGNAGAYGSCDFNYAADGSHEHCDNGWAPFVGYIHNCYWVNTRP